MRMQDSSFSQPNSDPDRVADAQGPVLPSPLSPSAPNLSSGQIRASGVKRAMAWCFAAGRRIAAPVWKYLCDAARYYWEIRQLLGEYLAGCAPNLKSESVRMREVRLAPYETYTLAEFDTAGWKATVPGRCVVCGETTPNPMSVENLSIDDASQAFWIPVTTWLFGIALSLFLWNRWWLVLALPLGGVVGYALRKKTAVRLRVTRCDEHVTRTNIPQVFVFGSNLVLRFGHKLVRRIFLYGEPMETAVPQPNAWVPSPLGSSGNAPPPYIPETIPLADSPSPEESTIRHDLPQVFDQDRDSPSSPVIP